MKFKRTPGVPHPVDIHVGGRLRDRRVALGISQTNLGDTVGLTFQQIQKYERGANRVGSGRLYQFAGILDVPISYFFEGLEGATAPTGLSDGDQATLDGDALVQNETKRLIDAYYQIKDDQVRHRVFELAKAVAADS